MSAGGSWCRSTPSGTGSIAVATPLTGVDSTLNQLMLFDVIIGAGVLIVLAGLSYVAVRHSLRPLVDVEHTAAAIAAGDLTPPRSAKRSAHRGRPTRGRIERHA